MGKQYNKKEKAQRRKRYNERTRERVRKLSKKR